MICLSTDMASQQRGKVLWFTHAFFTSAQLAWMCQYAKKIPDAEFAPIFNRLRPDLEVRKDRAQRPCHPTTDIEFLDLMNLAVSKCKHDRRKTKYMMIQPVIIKSQPGIPAQYFHQDVPEEKGGEDILSVLVCITDREFEWYESTKLHSRLLKAGTFANFLGTARHRGGKNSSLEPSYAFHCYLIPKIAYSFLQIKLGEQLPINFTCYDDSDYDKDNSHYLFEILDTEERGKGLFFRKNYYAKEAEVLCSCLLTSVPENVSGERLLTTNNTIRRMKHIKDLTPDEILNYRSWCAIMCNDPCATIDATKRDVFYNSKIKGNSHLKPSGRVTAAKKVYKKGEELTFTYGELYWKQFANDRKWTFRTTRTSKRKRM